MDLELTKTKLKEMVSLAEKTTGKNLSLPILSSILLEAKDNTLTTKSTNLDVGLEISIPVKINEEGVVVLQAAVLSGFLNNLSKGDKIKVSTINNNVHISTDYSSTLIKSLPADDFPIIPRVSSEKPFSCLASDLVEGLRSVIYASSLSDIKPEISSVYIYQDSKDLVFVATDSFRLAEKRVSLKSNKGEFEPVIIPFKNVTEIVRVFDGCDESLRVESDKNQISLFTDSIHLTSRVIDGIFPDYGQIMPKEHKTNVVAKKEELLNALKLSTIFSDKFNQVNIKVHPAEKIFEINSANQDVGENTVNIEAELGGEDIEASFNVKYIIDCFQTIDSPTIIFQFNGKNRPLFIKGMNNESFRYIVMPINR